MALKLDHESKHGVVGNYWKVNRRSINIESGFTIELFKDRTASNQGKQPLDLKFYKFPVLDTEGNIETSSPFTIESMDEINPVKIGYEWLKVNAPLFKDAIDD